VRAREMMAKLDRLPTPKSEVKLWDLSLLSPHDYDRATYLLRLIGCSEDKEAESLNPACAELSALVRDLPLLGKDDPEQGPVIAVPDGIVCYWQRQQKTSEWRHYSFFNLGKVQTLRFVELCKRYGYAAGHGQVKEQMTPLAQWRPEDRAEMAELLEIAASQR
jgi:hypothetical protein